MHRAIMMALLILAAVMHAWADAPAAPGAAGTLLDGRIEYQPPDGWKTVKSNLPAELAAVYVAPDHDGYFALQVLPENAAISPAAAKKIVAQLKINHKKRKQEIVLEPQIEEDKRFAIRIHERYKTADGKTADESHLYRLVGGRALELDVQSLSEEPEKVAAVLKTADEVLLSATWVKPNRKSK